MKQTNNFSLRPATMADLEAVVEFYNMWEEAAAGIRSATVENMRSDWEMPGFDLAASTRLVMTPDNEIVGWVSVMDISDPPVNPRIQFCVHPERNGQGIGSLILEWAEQRCQMCLTRVPEDIRVAMETGMLSTHEVRRQRLERAGFEPVRHFFDMEIVLDTPPPAPQWPEGITVHHYQSMDDVLENLEPIMTAVNEAFRDHWGHVERSMAEVLKLWTHRLKNDSHFDPTLWFMAMDGAEIAGTALCWPRSWESPDEGYVGILSVRRPWRRRGLGLALLRHSFAEFYQRGQPKAALGVDAASPTGAVGLYEKAGMHINRTFIAYEKELRPGRKIST